MVGSRLWMTACGVCVVDLSCVMMTVTLRCLCGLGVVSSFDGMRTCFVSALVMECAIGAPWWYSSMVKLCVAQVNWFASLEMMCVEAVHCHPHIQSRSSSSSLHLGLECSSCSRSCTASVIPFSTSSLLLDSVFCVMEPWMLVLLLHESQCIMMNERELVMALVQQTSDKSLLIAASFRYFDAGEEWDLNGHFSVLMVAVS